MTKDKYESKGDIKWILKNLEINILLELIREKR